MAFSHLAHDSMFLCSERCSLDNPGAMLANYRLHRPFTTVLAPAECHVETREDKTNACAQGLSRPLLVSIGPSQGHRMCECSTAGMVINSSEAGS